MAKDIWFHFPELPVSINKLYFSRGGRKTLSSLGRAYKNKFISGAGGASKQKLMSFQPDQAQEYDLTIWCFLPYEDLYSTTFGVDKRVKFPFKTVDVDNYSKLAIDCISALTGINDRGNFSVHLHKRESGPEGKRLVAHLKPLDLMEDPYGLEHEGAA